METSFPIIESILSPQALVENVLPDFQIGNVIACQFFSYGFNHTYIVKTENGNTYYARIYRLLWRNLDEIRCELDVLIYLNRKNCAAAMPCSRKDGSYYCAIDAPEGRRYMVLFCEAPGSELSYENQPQTIAYQYGQAVARLHDALDGFTSPYPRFFIDLSHLIEQPLHYIEPFLSPRTNEWLFLKTFANTICRKILEIPVNALEQGFCHGDLQGYHANITKDGTITFYDFDCGGHGFRAYDLAVFLWFAQLEKQEHLRWVPFLQGYQDIHPLNALDIASIPLFLSARYIWHMGIRAQNSLTWGCDHLSKSYFDKQLNLLHDINSKYFSKKPM